MISFAHLQLFFPSFAEIFCSRGEKIANAQTKSHILNLKITKDNQGEPAITSGKDTSCE